MFFRVVGQIYQYKTFLVPNLNFVCFASKVADKFEDTEFKCENKPFLVKVFVLQEILHFKKSEMKMKNTVNENFLLENTIKAHAFNLILWEAEKRVNRCSKNEIIWKTLGK